MHILNVNALLCMCTQEGHASVLLDLSETVPDAAATALALRRSVAAAKAAASAAAAASVTGPGSSAAAAAEAEAMRAQLLVADAVLRQPLPAVPEPPPAAAAASGPAVTAPALSGPPEAAIFAATAAAVVVAAAAARRTAEEKRGRARLAQQQCARRLMADAAAGLAVALGSRHPEAMAARLQLARLLHDMAADAAAAAQALFSEAADLGDRGDGDSDVDAARVEVGATAARALPGTGAPAAAAGRGGDPHITRGKHFSPGPLRSTALDSEAAQLRAEAAEAVAHSRIHQT